MFLTELWISSMPVMYFESLLMVYKNVLIDQLNTNTNSAVSIMNLYYIFM